MEGFTLKCHKTLVLPPLSLSQMEAFFDVTLEMEDPTLKGHKALVLPPLSLSWGHSLMCP